MPSVTSAGVSCRAALREPSGGQYQAPVPSRDPVQHYRSDEAYAKLQGTHQVVTSVDHVRHKTPPEVPAVVKGKRFYAMGLADILGFYAGRGSFYRHLYESLRTGHPYKPVLDLDRAIEGPSSPGLKALQLAYTELFLPLLVAFFETALRVSVTADDVRSLDASLEGKKFSKHIVLHVTTDSGEVLAYKDRATEMALMGAFRHHVEKACMRDKRLFDFYYFVEKGSAQTIVDYAIYHNGKRDMRLVGSCKANGKHRNKALRTLLPESHDSRPFAEFVCNVFASPCRAIVACQSWGPWQIKRKRARPRTKRKRSGAVAPLTDADDQAVDTAIARQLCEVARAAGADANAQAIRKENRYIVPVNYTADAETGVRRCLFGVRHSRHWAQINAVVMPKGSTDSVVRAQYYCHGCGSAVDLFNATRAAEVRRKLLAKRPSACAALAHRLGLSYKEECTPYLSQIDMHSSDKQTIVLRSGMGSGKTTRIQEYLAALPPEISVLCIGYRRVLNSALAEKFDLLDYQQATSAQLSSSRRLCVQVDSLPRLLVPTDQTDEKLLRALFDVVVVDEIESTLDHFASDTLCAKVLVCWKIFQLVVQRATKAIFADADAGVRTLEVVTALRLRQGESLPVVLENTFMLRTKERPENNRIMCDCFVWLNSLSAFFDKACELLFQKKPVYLATNSRGFAHAFRALVIARARVQNEAALCEEDVLLIDKDVPESEKRGVRQCNTDWLKYKLVICTPTVGAGIDFHVPGHFHATFVYATDKSTTPREVNQQRGRVRCPIDKRCYMLIDTYHNELLEESPSALSDALEAKGDAVVHDLVETTSDNEWLGVRLSKTPQLLLRLFALHEAERNVSRNNMRLAMYQLLQEKYPKAEHVFLGNSGLLSAVAGTEVSLRTAAHRQILQYKTDLAQKLVVQPLLDKDEVRTLTRLVITGQDEDDPGAKCRLHMQSIRDFYPAIKDWSVTDILTIGHPAFMDRVRYACALLGDSERSTDDQWLGLSVSGAAQFSLAHRTALERKEPPGVTRAFFSIFAFFAGVDIGGADDGAVDEVQILRNGSQRIRTFFSAKASLHSALSHDRIRRHAALFESLERKFSLHTMRQASGPCRKKVRAAFRKHVAAHLGIQLADNRKHKHDANRLHDPSAPCDCHRVKPAGEDVAALLAAVHAHVPSEVSGIVAGTLLLQHAPPGDKGRLPVACAVRGVGMASKPVRPAQKGLHRGGEDEVSDNSAEAQQQWSAMCLAELTRIRKRTL